MSSSDQQPDSGVQAQSFTPEELRKAARAQTILYIVMAVLIVLPFIVMWLRKGDSAQGQAVKVQSPVAEQTAAQAEKPTELQGVEWAAQTVEPAAP